MGSMSNIQFKILLVVYFALMLIVTVKFVISPNVVTFLTIVLAIVIIIKTNFDGKASINDPIENITIGITLAFIIFAINLYLALSR